MKNLRFLIPFAIVLLFTGILASCNTAKEDIVPIMPELEENIDDFKYSGDQEDSIRDPFGS